MNFTIDFTLWCPLVTRKISKLQHKAECMKRNLMKNTLCGCIEDNIE